MRPSVVWPVLLVTCAIGCRSNSAIVESQLRRRESEVRELRGEVARCGSYNQALELELRALRGDLPIDGLEHGPAYPVRSLTLGRGTGGRDEDGQPGDEALEVHLEPRDSENQVIKVPGSAIVRADEIGADGIKRPISSWEISSDQLRKSWKSGLLSTGYVLVLPWQNWPTREKLRVTVQFRLADGRLFEADRDVTIRTTAQRGRPTFVPMPPAAGSVPPPMSVPPPTSPTTVPPPASIPMGPSLPGEDEMELPAPRKLKPNQIESQSNRVDPSMRPAVELLRPRAVSDSGSWSKPG